MEYVVIVIVLIFILAILAIVCGFNNSTLKEIKSMENEVDLNELTNKLPSNIEVCKKILKKLNNEKVKVEENKESNTSLYIALTDKISIANVKDNFTRIQTIAHECLHSVQDRKMLLFNFWFSNIYLLYFVVILVLLALNILPYKMMFISILIILSMVYYFVRSYLENDAMIKARYLSKEYMEEENILSKEEIDKIVNKYDYLNKIGIKCVNFQLFSNTFIKILIIGIISIIR